MITFFAGGVSERSTNPTANTIKRVDGKATDTTLKPVLIEHLSVSLRILGVLGVSAVKTLSLLPTLRVP